MMSGIKRIAAERKRQIEEEGWSGDHDNDWQDEELALAAACYALPHTFRIHRLRDISGAFTKKLREYLWPWKKKWWKPKPKKRIRELEKAGALIAAEIDRLSRLTTEGSEA